jgi:pilus assembly protein CpaC
MLACVASIACLLFAGNVFAADSVQCLRATPDSECFQDLVLDIGGSAVIDIDKPTKEMKFVTSNDNIIDVRPFKENKLYIRGKEVGHGTLTIYDQTNGKTLAKIEVDVKPLTTVTDLTNLKRQFAKAFPGQDINVEISQKGIVLYGTVNGAEVVEQALRLADGYLSSLSGGLMTSDQRIITLPGGQTIVKDAGTATATGRSGKKIINLLKIGGPQQVLLEVKFAEVNRSSARELQAGFSLAGLGSDFGGAITGVGTINKVNVGVTNPGSGILNLNRPALPNVFISVDNFSLYLRFLEEERLGRILAEPKLVTMSGQEASFLAGGEYPYQSVSADGVSSILFKDFGVGLKFTPIVSGEGLITLKVAPSVTDISETVDTSTGPQAVFSTRKLESTVQLRDGQTLALAGLLSDNLTEFVNKVPFLGDIPILGALFRSTNYQQKKTDLLIAVTPHLVNPVREGSISFPGEFLKPPNRFELYLEGKLEGRRSGDDPSLLSQHAFVTKAGPASGGMEGNFGHVETAR